MHWNTGGVNLNWRNAVSKMGVTGWNIPSY